MGRPVIKVIPLKAPLRSLSAITLTETAHPLAEIEHFLLGWSLGEPDRCRIAHLSSARHWFRCFSMPSLLAPI